MLLQRCRMKKHGKRQSKVRRRRHLTKISRRGARFHSCNESKCLTVYKRKWKKWHEKFSDIKYTNIYEQNSNNSRSFSEVDLIKRGNGLGFGFNRIIYNLISCQSTIKLEMPWSWYSARVWNVSDKILSLLITIIVPLPKKRMTERLCMHEVFSEIPTYLRFSFL